MACCLIAAYIWHEVRRAFYALRRTLIGISAPLPSPEAAEWRLD
jgi:hypothetical protein